MKIRLFLLAALSVAGLALDTSYASAFSLLPKCLQKNCECRPYNAFTPAPPCCATSCGHHHHGHRACCQGPIYGNLPPMCCGPMCGDMDAMSSVPVYGGPMHGAPGNVVPAPAMQAPGSGTFTPPPPTPSPVFNQTSMQFNQPMPFNIQPAGFQQMPYPAYPMNYYPEPSYPTAPASVPYYWYNGQ